MDDDEFIEFRWQTFAQLRGASDRVRTQLVPEFVAARTPAREAFFAINRSYFEEDVFRGQMVRPDDARKIAADRIRDPFYDTALGNLGRLRTERANIGGFEPLNPHFAETVFAKTFTSLDAAGPFDDEDAFLRVLAILDMLLQVSHFVKDGCGRTGEDLLVLFGERQGFPLTISLTGYRGAVDGWDRPLLFRYVTEKIMQTEVVRNFLRSLGFVPPERTPTHIRELLETLPKAIKESGPGTRQAQLTWPDGLDRTIAEIFDPEARRVDESDPDLATTHPYRLYAAFLAKEVIYLTLCLADVQRLYAGLRTRYPLSLACRERDLRDARVRMYLPIPGEVADIADEAVARVEIERSAQSAGKDVHVNQLLDQLRESVPRLVDLISAERNFEPHQALVQRLHLPVTPTTTAEDVREAILRDIKAVSDSHSDIA